MKWITVLFLLLVSYVSWAGVGPAPIKVQLTQPNGDSFLAYPKGHRDRTWLETADGYTILEGADGFWYYAVEDAESDLGIVPGNEPVVSQKRLQDTQNSSSMSEAHKANHYGEKYYGEKHYREKHLKPKLQPSFLSDNVGPVRFMWNDNELHQVAHKSQPFMMMQPALGNASIVSNQQVPHYALSSAAQVQQPIMVVMVSFNDLSFDYSLSDVNDAFFGESGSVQDFFAENSYDKFVLSPINETNGTTNDGILEVQLSSNHPNFGSNYGSASNQLVQEVFTAVDAEVDFSTFDSNTDGVIAESELAVIMVIAGYENAYGGSASSTPKIWAHRSEISSLTLDGVSVGDYAMFGERHEDHFATIGIMCHELGHLLFDLPDLYDRDGDSNGIGIWGVMGNGSWNYTTGHPGESPAHLIGWSKGQIGFSEIDDVTASKSATMSVSSVVDAYHRVWIDPYRHGEHFILENRQLEGFDAALPGTGLLVTHIDPYVEIGTIGQQNDDETHKLVDVEEASGVDDLDTQVSGGDQGDLFPGSANQTQFDQSTTPNTNNYAGESNTIALDNIAEAQGLVTLDITIDDEPLGDNIAYDEYTPSGTWGGAGSEIWIATVFDNTTNHTQADGVDVHVNNSVSVEIFAYDSLDSGELGAEVMGAQPVDLVSGWNRVLFSESLEFSSSGYLVIVVKYDSSIVSFPVSLDLYGDNSGNSYSSTSNTGFSALSYDVSHKLLISGGAAPDADDSTTDDTGTDDTSTDSDTSTTDEDTTADDPATGDTTETTTEDTDTNSDNGNNDSGGALGVPLLLLGLFFIMWGRIRPLFLASRFRLYPTKTAKL